MRGSAMVYYSGMHAVMDQLQQHLDGRFRFLHVDDPLTLSDARDATVYLIGPDEMHPVRLIQKITSVDRHLSIVLLTEKARYNKIRQTLHLSPFVGKNVTVVIYNPGIDYASVLETAQTRTNQKRSFSKINFARETTLSRISSPGIRLENLDHALENAPIGVLLVHRSGMVTGVNKKARQMFLELAVNQTHLEKVFPEKQLDRISKGIRDRVPELVQAEDFRGNFYEISISNVREGDNEYALLLINDVTERMERDQRLEAIMESLPQIAWTATPEGQVNYYTRGWYSYTNQSAEEALKDGWMSVVHPDDLRTTVSRWNESVRNQVIFQHAVRFRRFDGEFRWHLSRAVPVISSRQVVSMWVGTSADIHDQVMLAENLEKKVKERTRSLEVANEELEQFAYVASHDLQEPLRKIQTFADLIREDTQSLDEDTRRYLDKIIVTATRMSKLLKDLLSFTRLHHNEGRSATDIGEIISGISDDLELVISGSKAEIQIEDRLPTISGYPSQLKQLFYNLINNSLKFRSPERSPLISISARSVPVEEIVQMPGLHADIEYWEIVVRDNGIGFDQKYADQIFTIFQRLHAKTKYEGTGIGLAICRKVVANHNGAIFATSAPGEGAEFHVLLPRTGDGF